MGIDIGKDYWKNRDALIKEFKEGNLRVISLHSSNNRCYFCFEHISDRMMLLVREYFYDSDIKHIERYCACRSCFTEIRDGRAFLAPLSDN